MKIALVSSIGGHLSELWQLREVYERYDHFYVLNAPRQVPDFMEGNTYFIAHAERDWKNLWNLIELWKIFRKERPDGVLSCGAGCAVPAFVVASALGLKRVFVETFCAMRRPSLTGRLIYRLGLYDDFLYQWPYLVSSYPKGRYSGAVYDPGFRRDAHPTF